MKRAISIIAATVALLLLGACATAPMSSAEQDSKAKSFTPPPGQASLYIYRNENYGAAVPMTVTVNGKTLGDTVAMSFFHLNLQPGKYQIESRAENTSTLSVNLEAGKNSYVWQEVKMGLFMARSLLQEVDEKTGRAGVMESKMLMTSASGDDVPPLGVTPAAQKLRELQNLRKDGLITEEEFQKKRRELMEKL